MCRRKLNSVFMFARRCNWGAGEGSFFLFVSRRWSARQSQWSGRQSHDSSGRGEHYVHQHVSQADTITQGVIWLASSGVTSREVSSEKSAGSQYWASPAAWESNQAKPSFRRWSWKHETDECSCSARQLRSVSLWHNLPHASLSGTTEKDEFFFLLIIILQLLCLIMY